MNTGFDFLDKLTNGYSRTTHIFYGEAGCYKSTILMKAAAEFSKHGKVFYVDPMRNFSPERLLQISEPKLENIFVIRNFNQTFIDALNSVKDLQCLIIDPVTYFWLKDLAAFVSMMSQIKRLTTKIPVLMSAEVYTDIEHDQLRMKAHGILVQFCAVIVELEKRKVTTGGYVHVAMCRKHPSLRLEGKEADFVI